MRLQYWDGDITSAMPKPIKVWQRGGWTIHYPVWVSGWGETFKFPASTDLNGGGHWEYPTLAEAG